MQLPGVDFERFLDALERRHTASLSFSELRRAVQALSRRYVSASRRLGGDGVFGGAGKRAAFATYFAPLHFLTVQRVVEALELTKPNPQQILDLGCGTGLASAAWALAGRYPMELQGVDSSGWAVAEARWSWKRLGLIGQTRRARLETVSWPRRPTRLFFGYVLNELPDAQREALLPQLESAVDRGCELLIVEPIARRAVPWWDGWATRLQERDGRADTWRFAVELPAALLRMDRAAGLDHRELTARSLYVPGRSKRR